MTKEGQTPKAPPQAKVSYSRLDARITQLEKDMEDGSGKKFRDWGAFFFSLIATALSLYTIWFSRVEGKKKKMNDAFVHCSKAWDYIGEKKNSSEILASEHIPSSQNLKGAEYEILEAKKKAPKLPLVYIRHGDWYKVQGMYSKAISEYETAIRINKHDAKGYRKIANVFWAQNEADLAILNYTRAVLLSNEDYLSFYNRAIVYQSQNKIDLAIEDYSNCISVRPSFVPAWVNRGSLFKGRGDLNKALADYSEALKRTPNDNIIFYNRGLTYRELGKLHLAIGDFERAIVLNPDYTNAYFNRGLSYRELGMLKRAVDDFARAIQLGTSIPWIDTEIPINHLNSTLKKNPDDINSLINRALFFAKSGEQHKGLKDIEKCMHLLDRGSILKQKTPLESKDDMLRNFIAPKPDSLKGIDSLVTKALISTTKQKPKPPLHNGHTKMHDTLTLHPCVSFSPPPILNKVRILIVVPNNKNHEYIDPLLVYNNIVQAWNNHATQVVLLKTATLENLSQHMQQEEPYDILHITSHGIYLQNNQTGYLLFEDGDGGINPVDGEKLVKNLSLPLNKRPKLITLLSCDSGRTNGLDSSGTNSVGFTLSKHNYNSVIGMQYAIKPSHALTFSFLLYKRLSLGKSAQAAFKDASMGANSNSPLFLAKTSPVLFWQCENGKTHVNTGP